MGHKIRDKMSAARLVEIEGAGHCLPSEVPKHCARIIEQTELRLRLNTFDTIPTVTRSRVIPFQDEGRPNPPFELDGGSEPHPRFAVTDPSS
jgi:hypothetical protein